MKKIIFIFLLVSQFSFAKEVEISNKSFSKSEDDSTLTKRKNAINFELGGTGLLYSFGFERFFKERRSILQSLKLGVSYQPFFSVEQVFFPLEYQIYLGDTKGKILLGGGLIGLIGPSPSPGSSADRRDYKNLYLKNPADAIAKYNTDRYEQAVDIAYCGKVGFRYFGRKVDWYLYYNFFYIRFVMKYSFQPIWLGAGISYSLDQ